MNNKKLFFGLILATLGFAGSASAATLHDLIVSDEPFVVGDKKFDNFSYSATGDMPSASDINVSGLVDGNAVGIQFQGGFYDLAPGASSDALIGFDVWVMDQDQEIIEVHLKGNPSARLVGGFATVDETVFGPGASLHIEQVPPGNPFVEDSALLETGYQHLSIRKDIQLLAGTQGPATLSFVEQWFVQQPVPEPSSFGMLAVGALALLRRRR